MAKDDDDGAEEAGYGLLTWGEGEKTERTCYAVEGWATNDPGELRKKRNTKIKIKKIKGKGVTPQEVILSNIFLTEQTKAKQSYSTIEATVRAVLATAGALPNVPQWTTTTYLLYWLYFAYVTSHKQRPRRA